MTGRAAEIRVHGRFLMAVVSPCVMCRVCDGELDWVSLPVTGGHVGLRCPSTWRCDYGAWGSAGKAGAAMAHGKKERVTRCACVHGPLYVGHVLSRAGGGRLWLWHGACASATVRSCVCGARTGRTLRQGWGCGWQGCFKAPESEPNCVPLPKIWAGTCAWVAALCQTRALAHRLFASSCRLRACVVPGMCCLQHRVQRRRVVPVARRGKHSRATSDDMAWHRSCAFSVLL